MVYKGYVNVKRVHTCGGHLVCADLVHHVEGNKYMNEAFLGEYNNILLKAKEKDGNDNESCGFCNGKKYTLIIVLLRIIKVPCPFCTDIFK